MKTTADVSMYDTMTGEWANGVVVFDNGQMCDSETLSARILETFCPGGGVVDKENSFVRVDRGRCTYLQAVGPMGEEAFYTIIWSYREAPHDHLYYGDR